MKDNDEIRRRAINTIVDERERQIDHCKHGGDTDLFDESNTQNDWIAFVNAYIGRAADKVRRNVNDGENFCENMIKAGALCLAAIEAHDKGHC